MWRLVDISPSIWWPLKIKVSDSPTTKSRTAPTENNKTTTQVAIAQKDFFLVQIYGIKSKTCITV
jgi:hypothetical protein